MRIKLLKSWRYAYKEVGKMYVNLLGQKAYHHLTDADMGKIIGVSRASYSQKIRSGRFWPSECKAFCKYFNKTFEYLFETETSCSKLDMEVRKQ